MTALAIAGLMKRHASSSDGQILFEGKNLLTLSRGELRKIQGNEISMVFQEPMTSLNPVMRIGKQVGESLRLHTKLSKDEIKNRVIQALRDVELRDAERIYNQYPHELSGGMRQRVMIASAFICNPKLLIADEPTTALDVTVQAQIIALIQKMSKEHHTAVLFISHDLSLVQKLCHRALVMYQGQLIEDDKTEQIFKHPKHEYTKKLINSIPKLPEDMMYE
ncbi:Oligopeptide transport ATP-binding protein OppD [Lachnospiraceae bacterium TWA4]|nr:Oligopeptide transport ATP-binding protein OppD [Lachnospiraceae bacterium TWA4]